MYENIYIRRLVTRIGNVYAASSRGKATDLKDTYLVVKDDYSILGQESFIRLSQSLNYIFLQYTYLCFDLCSLKNNLFPNLSFQGNFLPVKQMCQQNVMVKTVSTEVRLTTWVQILILSLLSFVTVNRSHNLSFNLICKMGIFAICVS